ncbi:MAG: CbiX/SirB N-terminal domain-containing protein [Pseudomonadota bacterium]
MTTPTLRLPQTSTSSEGLIISHGSPSDPEPQERFIRRLAERVAARTGWDIRGATLAKPGALDTATVGMTHPWVFPLFMSDGWFVTTNLQNKLGKTGLRGWDTLAPLGQTDALPSLALRILEREMKAHGLPRTETTLLVAAHGSPSNTRPAAVTREFAEKLESSQMFREVRVGFVDEAPTIEDSAVDLGPAIVLPFFAARAGHVLSDLPDALAAAEYDGPVLPPIGAWDAIPMLIADIVRSQRTSE